MKRFLSKRSCRLLALAAATTLLATWGVGLRGVDAQEKTPPGTANQTQAEAVGKPAGSSTLVLGMKDFGDPDGYTLKTVRTQRSYYFTRPQAWKVLPSSHVTVTFQHSAKLLPERSSLNVLVNNRILKTISLDKENAPANTVTIPVPPELLKDRNTLAFQVDQHYTYQCEDPFSEELWTTLLPETALHLDYAPQKVQPDLARWPYPFFDELGYGTGRLGYVAPATLSNESLEALAVAAAHMGQQYGWRKLKPFHSTSLTSEDASYVVVGTPAENSAIGGLSLPLPASGGRFADARGAALPEDAGIIQVAPHPSVPGRAVLVLSGNSPAGVRKAARLLAQNPPNKLLVGNYAVVLEQNPGPEPAYRNWREFVREPGQTFFHQIGSDTLSTRGVTALPLFYTLRIMPDLAVPGNGKIKLHTVYSYSSQLDASQSKLEVVLNGKSLKSVPLDNPKGEAQAVLDLEIPAQDVFTYNELKYQFFLYPEKYDLCRFVTDAHIWGTVHNTSSLEVPGTIKAALPDLGLINDGGYPFTAFPDLRQLGLIMPERPSASEMEAMLQVITRLGRISKSPTGINLMAAYANNVPEALKKDTNVILVGTEQSNAVLKDMKSKSHLLLAGDKTTLEGPLAQITVGPAQGLVEQLLSPFNSKRVAMILTGASDPAIALAGRAFETDDWFYKIDPGNLLVVNEDGIKTFTALEKGEARFLVPLDFDGPEGLPVWAWIALGVFALLGVFSLLRFFMGGK